MAQPPDRNRLRSLVTEQEDEHDAAEHSRLVMEAMRHLADQQVSRADRLRTGARQIFAYVTGVFTIAQVAAFAEFGQEYVSEADMTVLIISAMVAAAFLVVTGGLAITADSIRRVPDMRPEDITREADKAIDEDEFVADKLTKLYADAANSRIAAANSRRESLHATMVFAVVTLVAVVAEVAISLYVRLP